MTPTAADVATLLRARGGHVLTKVHILLSDGTWHTKGYDHARFFDAVTEPTGDIRRLAGLLSAIEGQADLCVVRGVLLKPWTMAPVRRRMHGEAAFASHPEGRRWVMLDIDGMPAPAWLAPQDPCSLRRAVVHAISLLPPPCFYGATAYYQWSSSAGVKSWTSLRLHLWFWLDRPAYDASLRQWLREMPGVDEALANAVQVHYMARPIFVGGNDPLGPLRSGLLVGDREEVMLPPAVLGGAAWRAQQAEAEARLQQELGRARVATLYESPYLARRRRGGYARGALISADERIRSAAPGQRHVTIVREAVGLWGLVLGGSLDAGAVRNVIVGAGRAVLPPDRHREIDAALSWASQHAAPRSVR